MSETPEQQELFGAQEDLPWWKLTRGNAWYKLNVAAAIALGVLTVVYESDVHHWLTGRMLLFPVAMVGLIFSFPAIHYVRKRWGATAGVWVVLLVAVLGYAAVRAANDAFDYNHSNCWTIRESESGGTTTEILECVPGKGEPVTGSGYNQWTESGGYRDCEQIDTSSSGGTIWRCESGEF